MTTSELLDQGSEMYRRQSVSGFVFGWDGGFGVDARKSGSEAVLRHLCVWSCALQRRCRSGVASTLQAVVELAPVAKEVGDAEASLSRVIA